MNREDFMEKIFSDKGAPLDSLEVILADYKGDIVGTADFAEMEGGMLIDDEGDPLELVAIRVKENER